MAGDAEHPFICLWALCIYSLESVCSDPLHIFNWIVCLPGVESCEFFMYFGDQTLGWGIVGKYIFLYGWLPFHFAVSWTPFNQRVAVIPSYQNGHCCGPGFVFLACRESPRTTM